MLTDLKGVLSSSKRRGAVASINTPCFENVVATIRVAEKLDLPIILSHAEIHEEISHLEDIAPVMLYFAEHASVPVCVHLDHAEDFEYLSRAVKLGFTSIMYDGSRLSFEDNARITHEAVKMCHFVGVSVEGELGRLVRANDGKITGVSEYTQPEQAAEFVERTGVDALAIAFGAAHGIYEKPPVLNFDVITRIRALTDVPLVMHGGSGLSEKEFRQVVEHGISKINYYTYMAYDATNAVKDLLERKKEGYFHDLTRAAELRMETNLENTLRMFSGI